MPFAIKPLQNTSDEKHRQDCELWRRANSRLQSLAISMPHLSGSQQTRRWKNGVLFLLPQNNHSFCL